MSFTPFRNIPSVNELLEAAPLRGMLGRLHPAAVASTVRAVLDEVRSEVQNMASERALPSISELADRVARRLMETHPATVRPFINATGILLHPSWAPPLAADAIEAIAAVAGNFSVTDASSSNSESGSADGESEALLRELTGAEAGRVFHSEAGAITVLAAGLANGREVIVARRDMEEVAPGVCIADLLAAGGATVRGVGSVRGATLQNYIDAMGEHTAAIAVVQSKGACVCDALPQVSLAELVGAAHARDVPVVHCLGSAGLVEMGEPGFLELRTLKQSVQEGADLVIAAGGGLLGGPPCGLLVGRRSLVERLERHPLAAVIRPNAIILAALAATLRIYRQSEKARLAIPLLELLSTSVANLKNRAERLAPQIAACPGVAKAEARQSVASLYPGNSPRHTIHSWEVAVSPKDSSAVQLATALRTGSPSVWVSREQDELLIDLRGIVARQDSEIVAAFQAINGQDLS